MLRAGAATLSITPPLGTALAGYRARTEGASLVYDDLRARCVAFEADGMRHAVLALDVMGVGVDWVDELRRRAERSVDLPGAHLLVAASHTHSAQGGLFSFAGELGESLAVLMGDGTARYDAVGYEQLLRQAESALRMAFARLEPASLVLAEGAAEGIAANRIWFERPADDRALLLAVRNGAGDAVAHVLHFACHPTTLGENDRGVSGDFPGVAARLAEQALGAPVLFLNGALGDVSTRLTRREQTYREVLRFGRLLGGEVVKLAARVEPLADVSIESSVRTVELAPRRAEWLERIEQRVAQLAAAGDASHQQARQLLTAREGVQSAARAADAIAGLAHVPVELQRFAVGDALAFVAVPGEIFSNAQGALDEACPGRHVRVVGPGNGYLGYFPSAEAYDEGGYEVGVSLVDRGAAEQLTEAAIDLLDEGGYTR